MTPRPFLAARWAHIIVLTFEAPEDLIRRSIPPGVDADRWNGRTHVSLVALQMLDVRIKGWRVPGFTTHAQVNFRTYVRAGGEPWVGYATASRFGRRRSAAVWWSSQLKCAPSTQSVRRRSVGT